MAKDDTLKLRERLGLSQEALAEALGLAGRVIICRWETGIRKPGEPVRRLIRLLNDLSVSESQALLKRLASYGQKPRRIGKGTT